MPAHNYSGFLIGSMSFYAVQKSLIVLSFDFLLYLFHDHRIVLQEPFHILPALTNP